MALSLPLRMPAVLKRALDSPRVARLFHPDYPPFALELAARRLVAVALSREAEGTRLERSRVVELPPGLVQPSLLRPAVADPLAFRQHLQAALEGLPGFEGRLSLVLPDRMAKVSFVELEQLAPTAAETSELIRWKLKRSTPFRVEDARIAYQAFPGPGGVRCLVSLVQAQVVVQLEELLGGLGVEVGLVDLASFNLWNLVHDRLLGPGDSLLLNLSDDQATAIIARGGEPLFVRCKPPTGPEPLTWEETRAELHPTLLYYQDRIGGAGIARALVRAPEERVAELAEILRERYGIVATGLEPEGLLGATALEAGRLSLLAPAIGAALGR